MVGAARAHHLQGLPQPVAAGVLLPALPSGEELLRSAMASATGLPAIVSASSLPEMVSGSGLSVM